MTRARPDYRVKIGSFTQGWEYITYEGQVPTAGLVQLLDGLSLTWGYDRAAYPGPLIPATCSFSLAGSTSGVNALPDPSVGDHIYIHLDRPGPLWPLTTDLIPYVHLEGILDEPEFVAHDLGGKLNLIVTDLVAGLNEVLVSDVGAWPSEVVVSGRIARIARLAPFNFKGYSNYDVMPQQGPITVPGTSALQLLNTTLNTNGGISGEFFVLRAVRKVPTDAYWTPMILIDVAASPVPAVPVTYVIQPIFPFVAQGAADQLVVSGNFVVRSRRAGRLSALAGLVLAAKNVLKDPMAWRKSRADAVNQVKLNGLDAAGAALTVVKGYDDLIRQNGANTRTVDSAMRLDMGLSTDFTVDRLLPPRWQAVPGWSTDGFVFTTENPALDDTDLDNYAPKFYPHIDPDAAGTYYNMHRDVSIVDVDATHSVVGTAIAATLIGGTFDIAGGVLRFAGIMRNGQEGPSGPTSTASYSDVGATPAIANCQYDGTGIQQRIDPNLSYADMATIGV